MNIKGFQESESALVAKYANSDYVSFTVYFKI